MKRNGLLIVIGFLLVPVVLTLLAIWHWKPGAPVLAVALLVGAGLEARTVFGKLGNKAYAGAVALALAAAFFLLFLNVAVEGILGDDPANMMYFGVLLVGFTGAIAARFEPRGMSWSLVATAFAMALVPAIALSIGTPGVADRGWAVFALHGAFAVLFAGSALLFRRAAQTG